MMLANSQSNLTPQAGWMSEAAGRDGTGALKYGEIHYSEAENQRWWISGANSSRKKKWASESTGRDGVVSRSTNI